MQNILIIIESSPLATNIFRHLLQIIPILALQAKVEIFFHKNAYLHSQELDWHSLKSIVKFYACPTQNENLPDFTDSLTIPQLGEKINNKENTTKVMLF